MSTSETTLLIRLSLRLRAAMRLQAIRLGISASEAWRRAQSADGRGE